MNTGGDQYHKIESVDVQNSCLDLVCVPFETTIIWNVESLTAHPPWDPPVERRPSTNGTC